MKKAVSMLLALMMLLTMTPSMALVASAAGSPVVNVPNTTGTGLSAEDPIICDNFEELKAVLEFDGTAYVSLRSSISEQLPVPSVRWEPAITMVGTKYLSLRGAGIYHSSADKDYDSLIKVNGHLTVDGDGSLQYCHNNNQGEGAVFVMDNAAASLTIYDGAFGGRFNLYSCPDDSWAFCRSIVATNGSLTIHGGSFSADVYDGPGVQSYQHRSAVYIGRGAKATINGGKFYAARTYSSDSPMDSHPCGMTFAPSNPNNIVLNGGTIKGMYITGSEKELYSYLGEECYFYNTTDSARFVGDVKESPYTDYETSDQYDDIEVVRIPETALQFGVLNPTPTTAEIKAGKSNVGSVLIGENGAQKYFSATATRLPDRELYNGFTTKLKTEVIENGTVLYTADNGNTINLATFAEDEVCAGTYQIKYTLTLWDAHLNTAVKTISFVYTVKAINQPVTSVRVQATAPIAGKTPGSVLLASSGVRAFDYLWYEMKGDVQYILLDDTDVFKSNTTYRLYMVAYPNAHYEFSDTVIGYVNNRSATIQSNGGSVLRFYYDFTTGDAELKSIAVTTPPTNTNYKEGDTLYVDGMVVTGYFADGTSRALVYGQDYTLEETKAIEGQNYFTISATLGGVTKTTTQAITVSPANYLVYVDPNGDYTFEPLMEGYTTAETAVFTVSNIGDQRTSTLNLKLSGQDADKFTLSQTTLAPMFTTGTNSQRTFRVTPVSGLAAGEYTATVTVYNDDLSVSWAVSVRVGAAATLSGTVTSFGFDTDPVYMQLFIEGEADAVYEQTLLGTSEYAFERVIAGEYILRVSKRGHITQEVPLTLTEDTVLNVELVLNVHISTIELDVYNYELALPTTMLAVATNTEGVLVDGYFVLDASSNWVTNDTFAAAEPYYLMVGVRADEGYDLEELLINECTLGGAAPINSQWQTDELLYLIFALEPLEAVVIDVIDMKLEMYEEGNDFENLLVSSMTDGVYAIDAMVVDSSLNLLEGYFEVGESYLVAVPMAVADGCTLNMTDIRLNGVSALAVYESGQAGEYVVVFLMPSIRATYEVDFVVDGVWTDTQYVTQGDTVSEPEEPWVDGYVFLGWYTDSNELYDFATPVTESFTLTAKMAKGHNVMLYFGDLSSPVAEFVVEAGKPMDAPAEPAQEGKVFLGWYLGDELYDFSKPVTQDLDLVAKFEVVSDMLAGDVNEDGIVDMVDAYAVYRVASGATEFDAHKTTLADMNDDGEIDMVDAYSVYRIASGAV